MLHVQASLYHQRKFISAGNRSTYSLNILFPDFFFSLYVNFTVVVVVVVLTWIVIIYMPIVIADIVVIVCMCITFYSLVLLAITESDRQVLIAIIERRCSLCSMLLLCNFLLQCFLFFFYSIWYSADELFLYPWIMCSYSWSFS